MFVQLIINPVSSWRFSIFFICMSLFVIVRTR